MTSGAATAEEWYSKSKRNSDGTLRSISASPWCITYCKETEDVFLWKNGERLKLIEGESSRSAGPVKKISPIEKSPGALLVSQRITLCAIITYISCLVTVHRL